MADPTSCLVVSPSSIFRNGRLGRRAESEIPELEAVVRARGNQAPDRKSTRRSKRSETKSRGPPVHAQSTEKLHEHRPVYQRRHPLVQVGTSQSVAVFGTRSEGSALPGFKTQSSARAELHTALSLRLYCRVHSQIVTSRTTLRYSTVLKRAGFSLIDAAACFLSEPGETPLRGRIV